MRSKLQPGIFVIGLMDLYCTVREGGADLGVISHCGFVATFH